MPQDQRILHFRVIRRSSRWSLQGFIRPIPASIRYFGMLFAAQDLKNRGMRLIVMEEQVGSIAPMKLVMKPTENYTEITLSDNVVVSCEETRAFLATIGS